jgi:predicted Mrr-cat superfamily restriction endonuclease
MSFWKDTISGFMTETKSKTASKDLEILVAQIQKQLSPQAEVLHNVKLPSRTTSTTRQIDVLVKQRIGQYEMKIVIDSKDYKVPVDVKGVEEFYGLVTDVGANKGVLVCPAGFTKAAKERAEGFLIDLYRPVDTGDHKWKATVCGANNDHGLLLSLEAS